MDTDEDSIWKNPSKSVVYSWIADYVFQETWEEFCAEYSVDSETDRKLISGIVQKVGNGSKSPEFILKSSLLIFISLLSDARDDLKDKKGDFEETILERALTILESNLQVEQFEKEFRQLAMALRLQAVLCCCRRDEWTLAEEVSQRLWPGGNEDSNAEKKIVNHILHSKKEEKRLDRYMTYHAFLEKTKKLLAKVVAQFSVPFLQTVCHRMTMPNSQETDEYSEYHSAEEGDDPHDSQMELNDSAIGQGNDPAKGHSAAEENNNQNNASQEFLLHALALQPQKKAAQANKKVEGKEEQKGKEDDEEDDLDVEVSQIEVRERELRSRTVPGFVKQTMTLKAPKKSVNVNKLEEKDELEDAETQIDNEMEDGDVEHDSVDHVTEIQESEDEDEEREAGSDGEKRKRKHREMEVEAEKGRTDEDDTQETSGNPPVSLSILKHSFRKLGHGRQFWRDVEEDLGSLHQNSHEQEVSEEENDSSQEEEPSDARKSSTPISNSFQRPLTFPPLRPPRLGRMKQLQIRPTKPTNGIVPTAKNSSKGVDEAGPSGVSNGHASHKNQRRKRLRELESGKEEEEGVRLTWSSDEDDFSDSDESIGSIISKASLKSPKLRKSLEGTSVDIRRPWTAEEVKRLIKGVKRFGVGRWSEIKDHYEFDRTNVNLKDKWRNLVKKYPTSNPDKLIALE